MKGGSREVKGRYIGRYIGQLSVDYRSTIGRLSAYMSTEATYSTHDPKYLA